MKEIVNIKKILVIALVAIIIGINTVAYANEATNISTISETGTSENSTANEVPIVGDVEVNETNEVAENNTIVLENEVPSEDLPDTGKEDTALLVLIGIVIVSSIYTYSKIKKYNV